MRTAAGPPPAQGVHSPHLSLLQEPLPQAVQSVPSRHPRLPVSFQALVGTVASVLALGLGMDPEPLEDTLARWSVTDCLLPACCLPSSAGLNVSTSEEGGSGLTGDCGGHVCSLPSAPAQGSRVQAQPAPGKASVAFGPGCTPGSLSPSTSLVSFSAVELMISLVTCGSQGPSWDSHGPVAHRDQWLREAPRPCAHWRSPGEPVWRRGGQVPSSGPGGLGCLPYPYL